MRGANEGEDVFPWTNFGFTTYADHHFHIGMWIYAIAHYAKYNMDWAMKDGTQVSLSIHIKKLSARVFNLKFSHFHF